MSNPVLVVVGAGPGVGASVARRFGREGYDVALVARSAERLTALGEGLQAEGITTGWSALTSPTPTRSRAAVERFGATPTRGRAALQPQRVPHKDPLTSPPTSCWPTSGRGRGVAHAVQAARPFLGVGGRVVTTGSMAADRPWHEAA